MKSRILSLFLFFLVLPGCLQSGGNAPGEETAVAPAAPATPDASGEADDDNTPVPAGVVLDPNYSYMDMIIYLAGPMSGMSGSYMRTTLGPLLPTTDPHNLGASSPNINSLPDIVDWIRIEFRNQNTKALVHSIAALLRKDGHVVDVDGSSYPKVNFEGGYFVYIKHRNHLPVRTYDGITLTKGALATRNYTTSMAFWQESGFPGQTNNYSGINAIKAGELTGDCEFRTADVQIVSMARGTSGYVDADLNFDGVVDNTDLMMAPWSGWSSINNSTQCAK